MAPGTRTHRGLFVTFEGIDGCGKSTQLARAQEYLEQQGCPVVAVREPGSTPMAERIRELLLDRRNHMSALTELLLYEAARAELTASGILPHLRRGVWVLCDRYYDSTTAYQGYGRGLDIAMVKRLHRIATGGLRPDLTLVFDLPVATGLARCGRRRDRLESQSQRFFQRVRQGFLQIARQEPRRVKVIDSRKPVAEVFAEVRRHLDRRLHRRR